MAKARVGIWLVGAEGGVATTAIVGLAALKKGLIGSAGLVSELPQFAGLDFAPWSSFVVGGHEIRDVRLLDEAGKLVTESRTLTPETLDRIALDLEAIDARIKPGATHRCGPVIDGLATLRLPKGETPRAAVDRLRADIERFIARENLSHTVVVNVSSTEPSVDGAAIPATWAELEKTLGSAEACPLPASSLYAIAAFQAGCSYVNFTPSLGSAPQPLDELAQRKGLGHMGCDGKTGETLLKSVLAPMFARRKLDVMSWVGHNIFGNMDGVVLSDPANKQSKVKSKDHLLGEILGYRPQTLVSIEYIQSMGDWKTAWDHIHFKGFLDVPMTLQFTWQGCDSVLAAPLVLDLVRFSELAHRRGESGRRTFLASFFKSPYGVEEHCFDRQYRMLEEWAARTHDKQDVTRTTH